MQSLTTAWRRRVAAAAALPAPAAHAWPHSTPTVAPLLRPPTAALAVRRMGGGPRSSDHRAPRRVWAPAKQRGGGKPKKHSGGLGSDHRPEHKQWKPRTAPEARTPLHDELVDFAWRSAPSFDAVATTCLSLRAVEEAWARHEDMLPGGERLGPLEATPFGSQAVALANHGGDLDMKVFLPEARDAGTATVLTRLHAAMEATHTFPGHSHHIRNARVPILTGKVITGQPVDLSYQPEGETDLAGAGVQLMRDLLDEYPQIKPLLLIVKAILKQHELNKAFTGGLSSFTLFNMVAGYLKHLAAAGELSDLARPLPRAADAAAPSTLPPATVLLPPPIMTCRSKLRLPWEQSLAAAVMWQDSIPAALPPYIRAATFRPSRVPTAAMRGARKQPRWPSWPLDPDADARVVGDAPLGPAPSYEPEDAPEDTVEHDLGPCLVPFVSEGEDSARLVDDVRAQAALQRERLVREADLGNLLLKILQRFGLGWAPRRDIVDLSRDDPLDPGSPSRALCGEFRSEAMCDGWDLDDAFDGDEGGDDDMWGDLAALEDAEPPKTNRRRGLRAGGRGGRGPLPEEEFEMLQMGGMYRVQSPFGAIDSGMRGVNLAGSARQGPQVRKALQIAASSLEKAIRKAGDADDAPLDTREVLTRALRAVIVYKGATEGEIAARLSGVADRAVRVAPQESAERGKLSNLDNNIMNAHLTVRNARRRYESNLPPVKKQRAFATMMRSDNQIRRWMVDREKWLAVRRVRADAARWGELYDRAREARLGDKVAPGAMSQKKQKKENKKARKRERKTVRKAKDAAGKAGLPYIGSVMHARPPPFEVAEVDQYGVPAASVRAMVDTGAAVRGVLLKQADDIMVERHAAAAAAVVARGAGAAAAEAWLEGHPAAAAALDGLARARGPFALERWVAGLEGDEAEGVAALAEWALQRLWTLRVKGTHRDAVGVRGADGALRGGLRADRARLAVDPASHYPQLSAAVDMAAVLGTGKAPAGAARADAPPPVEGDWRPQAREAVEGMDEADPLFVAKRPDHPLNKADAPAAKRAILTQRRELESKLQGAAAEAMDAWREVGGDEGGADSGAEALGGSFDDASSDDDDNDRPSGLARPRRPVDELEAAEEVALAM